MLLAAAAMIAQDAPVPHSPGAQFQTKKNLADLQECLTRTMSDFGEVAALSVDENSTTLLIRDNPAGPMVIEVTPPTVTVTTQFIPGTRDLVRHCV